MLRPNHSENTLYKHIPSEQRIYSIPSSFINVPSFEAYQFLLETLTFFMFRIVDSSFGKPSLLSIVYVTIGYGSGYHNVYLFIHTTRSTRQSVAILVEVKMGMI